MDIVGIHHITPSDEVNYLIWRWAHGRTSWASVSEAVEVEMTAGRFNPNTDIWTISRVARRRYQVAVDHN